MGDKIIAIAIEASFLNEENEHYINFIEKRDAFQKIDKLEAAMLDAYQKALLKKPDVDYILIAWSEHLICDDRFFSNSISSEAKHYFLEKMSQLITLCPKLRIASGSTLIRKEISKSVAEKTLNQIVDCYKEHEWVNEELKKKGFTDFEDHLNEVKEVIKNKNFNNLHVTKNVSFYFAPKKIDRKGKGCPFDENSLNIRYQNCLFQPGKVTPSIPSKHDYSAIHTLENGLTIVSETCAEHMWGFAKRLQYQKNKSFHFQLVNSNYINVVLKNLVADYGLLQVDSMNRSQFVLPLNHKLEQIDFLFFRYHLFNDPSDLEGPIAPLYPLQFQMIDFLKEKKQEYVKKFPEESLDVIEELIEKIDSFYYLRFSHSEIKKMNMMLNDCLDALTKKPQSPSLDFLKDVVKALFDIFNFAPNTDEYAFLDPGNEEYVSGFLLRKH